MTTLPMLLEVKNVTGISSPITNKIIDDYF